MLHTNDNQLASATTNSNTTSYSYDPAGELTQTVLPSGNGYTETRSYDHAGRLTGVDNHTASSTLSDYTATLDPVGNPTEIDQTGAVSSTETFTYDANDRLTGVCFQTGTCPGSSDPYIRWTYDKVGNRLTETRPAGTTTYTYNSLDELTSDGTNTYTYDQNGNQTSNGSRTFTYDQANRLATTTLGSTTTTYSYDGDGNRTQASTGAGANQTTNYLWDTNAAGGLPQLALERDGNNSLLRRYSYGARRISMTSGGNTYYYHYDTLGSATNLTSATGTTEWTYSYEPFGTTRTATQNDPSAPANMFKFAGEYIDSTALYNLRAREYDSMTGRLLQQDPANQVTGHAVESTYVYAASRPTVMIDPTGRTFVASDCGATAAAVTGNAPLVSTCASRSETVSTSSLRFLGVDPEDGEAEPYESPAFNLRRQVNLSSDRSIRALNHSFEHHAPDWFERPVSRSAAAGDFDLWVGEIDDTIRWGRPFKAVLSRGSRSAIGFLRNVNADSGFVAYFDSQSGDLMQAHEVNGQSFFKAQRLADEWWSKHMAPGR